MLDQTVEVNKPGDPQTLQCKDASDGFYNQGADLEAQHDKNLHHDSDINGIQITKM